MFTPFQKLQLKILKYGFFYLPSHPFQVEMDTGQVKISGNLTPSFIVFIILIVYNTIFSTLGCIFGWHYVELAKNGEIKSSGLIILQFCGIKLTFSGLVLLIFKEKSVIAGLRNMIDIISKLYEGEENFIFMNEIL